MMTNEEAVSPSNISLTLKLFFILKKGMQQYAESLVLQKCPHCTSTMRTGLYRKISRNSRQLDRTMHVYKVQPWHVTLYPLTSIR